MRFLRRVLIGLTLAALSLGGVAVAVVTIVDAVRVAMEEEDRSRPNREVVRAVNVVTVTPAEERPVLTSYGEVLSRRTLEVRATSSGAVVGMSPDFQDGGRVTAGQVLLQIDPATAEADLRVAEADLQEVDADLRDALRSRELAGDELLAAEEQFDLRRQAMERQEDLAERGVGTGAAVEDAALSASSARQAVVSRRQALAAAEARIDQTRTRKTRTEIALTEAQRALDDTTIRAQFAGTLSEVTLVEGGLVNANEKLAQLVDPKALEVAFRISTAQHARLLDRQGELIGLTVEAVLEVAGLDLSVTGVIDRESAVVGDGQTGRLVFARLDSAPGFRPGDFVTLKITEPPLSGVARLPAAALGPDGTLLALGAEDRLEPVQVRLERRQGDTVLVRVPDGLAGRSVVAERTPLLGAGLKVRPSAPVLGAGLKVRPSAPVPEGAAPPPPEMLTLDPERRARLVAFVEGNSRMPGDVKSRILGQLEQDSVPAQMVERLESRMGS